jgi:hypothetical protein
MDDLKHAWVCLAKAAQLSNDQEAYEPLRRALEEVVCWMRDWASKGTSHWNPAGYEQFERVWRGRQVGSLQVLSNEAGRYLSLTRRSSGMK